MPTVTTVGILKLTLTKNNKKPNLLWYKDTVHLLLLMLRICYSYVIDF